MSFERIYKIEVEEAIKIIEKYERNGSISHIAALNIIQELHEESSIDRYHKPK